ncbi:hypothetical protein LTR04_004905 [Oleoguttula sp. CCFEE 6159]|nr:hypothetical protein LTR04_004905 [Oleoguttula sp. CCFEE 6159]
MVTWWDEDSKGNVISISLLVKLQEGLTEKLLRRRSPDAWFVTAIDGPYGSVKELGDYGSVVMVASGIGIASQIPFIKELLKGCKNHTVRTRRIFLVWQLDKESKRAESSSQSAVLIDPGDRDWVCEWMDELLANDVSHVLDISLYDYSREPRKGEPQKHGSHDRLRSFSGHVDIEEVLCDEISSRKGRMLITGDSTVAILRDVSVLMSFLVSTTNAIRDQIREITRKLMDDELELMDLVFQPMEKRRHQRPVTL